MGAVCHNTRSTQANETDEDTNNAEGDLFSEEVSYLVLCKIMYVT